MKTEQEIRERIILLAKVSESFSDEPTLWAYLKAIEQLQWVLGDES